MRTVLFMAAAGAAGTLARYWGSLVVSNWLGSRLPWGTLAVNLTGCFLIGYLMEMSREPAWVTPEMRIVLGVGFLGGLTTFSTFGADTFRALEAGDWLGAGANVSLNLLGGLALIAAGISAARYIR